MRHQTTRHSGEACAGLDPVAGVQNIKAPLDSGFRRNDKMREGQSSLAKRYVHFSIKLAARPGKPPRQVVYLTLEPCLPSLRCASYGLASKFQVSGRTIEELRIQEFRD